MKGKLITTRHSAYLPRAELRNIMTCREVVNVSCLGKVCGDTGLAAPAEIRVCWDHVNLTIPESWRSAELFDHTGSAEFLTLRHDVPRAYLAVMADDHRT